MTLEDDTEPIIEHTGPVSFWTPRGDQADEPREDENEQPVEHRVYPQRWYILALFSLFACLQCVVWNTFGPIDNAIICAYGWSDSTIAMMGNWGTILFCLTVVPLTWMLEHKGLRQTTILVSALTAVGTVLRTLSREPTVFLVMSHVCAILNGISGVTVMSAPPALSADWFPPEERTTATAVNIILNQLGNGISFLLGPKLVPFTGHIDANGTVHCSPAEQASQIRYIEWYMIGLAAVAVGLLLLFVVYFPSKPPIPPSVSSAVERTEFLTGLRSLARNRNFWLCACAYCIPAGIMGAWYSVVDLNFQPLGVPDTTIGTIVFASVIGCCIISLISAFAIDHLKKQMKLSLMVCLSVSTASFVWLALLCLKVIPFDIYQVYISVIVATGFNFASGPLFFEYTVEQVFPIPEGLVGGFLTGLNNLVGMMFLFLFFIPNVGYIWMDYLLPASTFLAIPLVIFSTGNLERLRIDSPYSEI